MKSPTPLAGYPVTATSRVGEAEECISRSIADARIDRVDDRHGFRLELNAISFGRFDLIYNRFDARTLLSSGAEQDHAIFITGMGVPIALSTKSERYLVTRNEAVVLAPANDIQIERPAHSEILYLRVPIKDLWRHLEKLTARHHRGRLAFSPRVSSVGGCGALLKRLMDNLVSLLGSDEEALKMPIILKSYQDLLMSAMLALPHNKTALLNEDRVRTVAPAVVRQAEEYMRSHLEEPITVSDLVRISECSRSALFASFRTARNYTPMEFLTEQRLSRAREHLQRARFKTSASSIALKCGFISYSWFSQVYKKRFGERPSDTLQRCK
jgi:AraC-like DNA-binding protein